MEGRLLSSKGKSRDDVDDDSKVREGRVRDERRKQGNKSTVRLKLKPSSSVEIDNPDLMSPVNGHLPLGQSRYHQRELPPRFQQHHHKQLRAVQKQTAKTTSCPAVTKKPTKDTSRWQTEHHHMQDHTLSNHTHTPTNDGGWSVGTRAKGSGWRKTTPISETPPHSNKEGSNQATMAADNKENEQLSPDSFLSPHLEGSSQDTPNKSQTEPALWPSNDVSWSSDQDGGSSRSQSPGGVVTVVKQVESTAPSKDGGTAIWDSKPMGTNWKMHTLDTKAPECSPEELSRENPVRGAATDWDDLDTLSLSSNERDPLFVCHKNNSSDESGVIGEETSSEILDQSPQTSSGGRPNSQETPLQSDSLTPGNATPTHEVGVAVKSGRTSVGSSSSQSDGGSSGVRNGTKGSSQQIHSTTSPRKMNRNDLTLQGSNGIVRATNILPRPRKSIAELEGGLESLHNAPSGWGDLPSPKSNDVDTGTEFWGIPPADIARMTGAEQQPSIKAWSESRSPRKVMDWTEEQSSWSGGENTRSVKWEVGGADSPGFYGESGVPPHSGPESATHTSRSGLDLTSAPNHSDTNSSSYPNKTRLVTNVAPHGAMGEPKDPLFQFGSQTQMNQVLVKNLVIDYRQLTKLQLGQLQSSGSLQSLQKSLSQQLNRAQTVQQQLLSQIGQTPLPAQHPLKVQLSQTDDIIGQIQQHILQTQQMMSQYKEVKGRDVSVLGSSMRFNPQTSTSPLTPPLNLRGKGDQKGSVIVNSQSCNTISSLAGGGGDGKSDLSYGMRDMSLSSQWSHPNPQASSAARSLSRLQRIISGSPTQDSLPSQEMSEFLSYSKVSGPGFSSTSTSSSPFSPPYRTVGVSPSNSGNASKPVHQIQEFKPGVPWQPRKMSVDSSALHMNQPPEQQAYSQRPPSQPEQQAYTQRPPSQPEQQAYTQRPPSQPEQQAYTQRPPSQPEQQAYTQRPPSQPEQQAYTQRPPSQPEQQAYTQRPPSQPEKQAYTQRPPSQPEQQAYTQRPPSQSHPNSYGQPTNQRTGTQRVLRSQNTDIGYYGNQGPPTSNKFGGMPGSRGGSDPYWNTQLSEGSTRPTSFPQRMWNGQRPNRSSLPSSNASTLITPPDSLQMGWRQQGRSIQPPSSLVPRPDFQQRVQYEGHRSRSTGTPIDAHHDGSQWNTFTDTPGNVDIGTSVWGSTGSVSPSVEKQGAWSQQRLGRGWNQGLIPSNPSGPSNFPTSSAPMKDHYSAPTPTSTGGQSGWSGGYEGFSRSGHEPVYSEWQSGKKSSRLLSASSQPASPPLSPWLVIKSTNSRLDTQSLRDTCKGYGDVKSFIGSPGADFFLVCYSSVEEAMHAKPHIDSLWEDHVVTEFVAEGDLEMLCQQLTMSESSMFTPPPTKPAPSPFQLSLQIDRERAGNQPAQSKWDAKESKPFLFERQTSKSSSTPGSSSVWSDGGFLSGISSPWSSDFSGTLTSPSTGYYSDATTTPLTQESVDSSRNSSGLPNYLPSGLL